MRFNLQYFTVLLLSKKINTVNAVKVFFAISWKNQVFYIFFFKFAKTIYTNKGFIYHLSRLNAAELLILYKTIIVLDPKSVNLL